MNLDNIKAFIDLAKSEGVSELKYEEKDLKISVNLNAAPAIQTHIPAMRAFTIKPSSIFITFMSVMSVIKVMLV